jgi:lipid-binding SYLF domain-containing protein
MSKWLGSVVLICGLITGCASVPKTTAKRNQLDQDAREELAQITGDNPSIQPMLDQAAAYVVFPSIKQGGFIVGGASGNGVVFEGGRVTGYAQLSQAAIGALAGGQKYSELIIFRDKWAFDKARASSFDVGGQASAVIIRAGASTQAGFNQRGLAVFQRPIGGAMVNASVTGQTIKWTM